MSNCYTNLKYGDCSEIVDSKCVIDFSDLPALGENKNVDEIVRWLITRNLSPIGLQASYRWGKNEVRFGEIRGAKFFVELLKIGLNNPLIFQEATDIELYVFRKRPKRNKGRHQYQDAGFLHPSNNDISSLSWLPVVPYSSNNSYVDFKPEGFFGIGEDRYLFAKGYSKRRDYRYQYKLNYAFVDLNFKLKYRINGVTLVSGFLGAIRVFAYIDRITKRKIVTYKLI